ncbi:MAG: transporter substrate-binding domain-containing protein [Spirochaetales bacterium]|nr:transporter substrate-binding domain-containing protein [Spirochaetales bacterium]
MRKKFIAFLLTAIIFTLGAQDLRLAVIEDQAIQSVCAMILTELYAEIGLEVEILPMSALRAQQEASSGAVDGEVARIASFEMIFPQLIKVPTVLYQNSTLAFVRKDSGIEHVTKEELKNYRVARIKGVVNTDRLTGDVPEVYDFDSMEAMMEFVRIGRADIALTSRLGGNFTLADTGNDEMTGLADPVISLDLYHFLHRKNSHIVPIIDQKLREMRESGEMEKLILQLEEELLAKK